MPSAKARVNKIRENSMEISLTRRTQYFISIDMILIPGHLKGNWKEIWSIYVFIMKISFSRKPRF